MLNALCVLGTIVGLVMTVSFLVLYADVDRNRDPSFILFIGGVIIMAISANGYDFMAKKMKYDAEKNKMKISQRNELHQKFLHVVKDDPDFKIYFEK